MRFENGSIRIATGTIELEYTVERQIDQLPFVGLRTTIQCTKDSAQQFNFASGRHAVPMWLEAIGYRPTGSGRWSARYALRISKIVQGKPFFSIFMFFT